MNSEQICAQPVREEPVHDLAEYPADEREDSIPLPVDHSLNVLAAWERLRLVYNLVLIGVVVLFGWLHSFRGLTDPVYWLFLLGGAFAANVFFCVGPCVEFYIGPLWTNRRRGRLILFALGLALALVFSVVSLGELRRMWLGM